MSDGAQVRADLLACRSMLRGGSRSFFAAALLLPARVHRPATALYAFCRVADDLIDGGEATRPLDTLRVRLDAIYRGDPVADPADRALAHVVKRHRLPRLPLDLLLEGFAWDAENRRYEDLPALMDYAARVAGTVGAMMATLMGATEPSTVARACELGMAMQLSNIARDVGADARAGRLYLPLAWLREARIDPDAFLADPAPGSALAGVVARLLAEADVLYRRADAGIAVLPLSCRPGIGAARHLYAAIGHQVARNGYDCVHRRASVPGPRKLVLGGRALFAAAWPGRRCTAPPLDAVRGLVAAVGAPQGPRGLAARLVWLLTLFSELDGRRVAKGG